MLISNVKDLKLLINNKFIFDYLPFYGSKEEYALKDKSDFPSCFSQWFPSEFYVNGVKYLTAEHFMMAEKARLFKDDEALFLVLKSEHPADAKKAGSEVKNFVYDIWAENCFKIVVDGNYAKFSQSKMLKDFIKSTGDKVLVEASPTDCVWGVGLSKDSVDCNDPFKWKGLNLLGFALMHVRFYLNHYLY